MSLNKLVGVAAVGLALAGGFAGAAYWSGQKTEQWYKNALAEASKYSELEIAPIRYERGLFSSEAVTRYRLAVGSETIADGADLAFSTREHIYHGPLPLAGWGVADVPMGLAAAVVRQTFDPESNPWLRQLAALYGGQDPVVAVTQVGFDGASRTRLTMRPLTADNVGEWQSLKFSGLEGQTQLGPHGTSIRGDFTVNSLEAVTKAAPAGEAQAKGEVRFSLRDLKGAVNQRKGPFDLMLGDSRFSAGELRIQDTANDAPVLLTNLGTDATIGPNPQNPQQVNIDTVFKAEKLVVESWNGTGTLRLAFHNLDGATLGQLQQWQQKIAKKPEDPQAINELVTLAKALLRGKPELLLDTEAKVTQGDWRGKLSLSFQDYGEPDAVTDLSTLLKILEKGSAEIVVSKGLADAMVARAGEQQLFDMLAAGFLRLEGDHYKATARFENGKLFVNDKEIPLDGGNGMNQ